MRHWKRYLWGAVCLLCLLGFLVLVRGDRRSVAQLTPQLAAERWETPEKPYAMASVFLPADGAIAQSSLGEIYLNVENALAAGGAASQDHPWLYAASAAGDGVLRSGSAVCDAEVTAVAGDFFQIHPMTLLSGWYMTQDDVMRDRIVLDRRAAWDLFYSDNVSGQFVELDGAVYQVAAVVEEEADPCSRLAAGDVRRAWILADAPGREDAGFTCLELVLPQPVRDFAAGALRGALGSLLPEKIPVTDNSARFGLKNRWYVLRHLAARGISDGKIEYPYWERAAQLLENRLALRLIPEAVLLLIPGVSLALLLWRLNRRRTWGLRSLRRFLENAVDRKRRRDWDRSHGA